MGGAVSAVAKIVSVVAPFAGTVGIVIGIASAVVGGAFQPRDRNRSATAATFDQQVTQRGVTVRGSVEPARTVYGTDKVAGVLAFVANSGPSNKFRHIVQALTWHEIEGFEAVYANDIEIPVDDIGPDGIVTKGRFTGKLRLKLYTGAPGQTADPDLVAEVAEWTMAHRGRGRAYIYARTERDDTAFPGGALPNFAARIKGKKDIFDPRDSSTGWSDNWALCVANYLESPLGFALPPGRVDPNELIAAANVSDELVPLAAGGSQRRYTCDGTIFLERPPLEVLEEMLTAGAGTAPYSQGVFKIFPGVYRAPIVQLDTSDLAGEITISEDTPRQDRFNTVIGTYNINRDEFGETDSFAPVTNGAYVEDDGEVIEREIKLRFTRHPQRARRIAKIYLERNRRGGNLDFPGQPSLLEAPIGENVTVKVVVAGTTIVGNEVYTVNEYVHEAGGGIGLKLQRDDSASYAWTTADEAGAAAPPALPDAENPPPEVLNFRVQQTGEGLVTMQWDDVEPRAFGYDLAFGPQGGDPDLATLIGRRERGTQVTDASVPPGTHVFYNWAVDEEGRRSGAPATLLFEVLNFNDLVAGEEQAPNWPGALTGFLVTVNHALTAAAEAGRTTAAATYEELFEIVNPYPVAESIYEIPELDLGFDAAGVRVYSTQMSGLIGGDTTGTPNAQLEIDYRLGAGTYDGFEPWTSGIRDFRFLKMRLRSDNATGKRRIQAFSPVVDVKEETQRAENVPIPLGGANIVFAQRFFAKPNFQAAAESQAGVPRFAVWDAANVSATGVTDVRIKDAAGTDLGGVLETWVAIGPLGRRV